MQASRFKQKKCRICDKVFKVKLVAHAVPSIQSDEGHAFGRAWFCNECWDELQRLISKEE